jgi:hypothetical protein
MSCGCSSTTTPSPSITCGSCGYQCTSCTCPVDPIVMPTVTCADPATCTEIYPLECIQYTGEDIKCSTENYPNVVHTVATNGDMLPTILSNINNQLCYLFSTDFISEMLNNINTNTELSTILCTISNECGTPSSTLICPTVSYLTYNVSDIQNYLQAQFSYVPFATSYIYKFYSEDTPGTNNYTAISGGTLPQPSVALPITISAVLTGTLYTISRKYIVLVQAVGTSPYTSNGPNLSTTYAGSSLTSANWTTITSSYTNNCGNNQYVQSTPSELSCLLRPLVGSFQPITTDKNCLNFVFTSESLNPASYSPTSYTVHWYLQQSIPTPTSYVYQYVYQGQSLGIAYSAGTISSTALTKKYVGLNWSRTGTTVTITSPNHGLLTGDYITTPASYGSGAIPSNTYTITYLTANTFSIVGVNTGSTSGTGLAYSCCLRTTDKVVVMIKTITANPEICSNGPDIRVDGIYQQSDVTNFLSNPQNNVFKNFQ